MNNRYAKPTKFEKARLILRRPRKVFWYWDIRLYIPFILIIYILTIVLLLASKSTSALDEVNETFIEADEVYTEPYTEPEIEEVEEISEEVYFEIQPDSEIVMLARLADSVAAHKSDEVKKIVMWVAINRAEDRSHGYGDGLRGEISRPKQWQCYDPYAAYLQSTYDLAEEVYNTWISGGPRPMYPDMLWFVFNSDGSITVRNQFKASKNRTEMTFGQ